MRWYEAVLLHGAIRGYPRCSVCLVFLPGWFNAGRLGRVLQAETFPPGEVRPVVHIECEEIHNHVCQYHSAV